jgi:hypothetical protein
MHLLRTLALITALSTASAWRIKHCDDKERRKWKTGKCYNYVADRVMFQSDSGCGLKIFPAPDCKGHPDWTSIQEWCFYFLGKRQIKSVKCVMPWNKEEDMEAVEPTEFEESTT